MIGLVAAATEYLEAGLSIIALSGKAPNAAIHPHGLTEPLQGAATSADDRVLLLRVFEHPATTGVGIVLPERLVVVDVDGEEGAVQFVELAGEAAWQDTPAASTGRGLHLYFLTPREQRTTKLGPKLDLKGVGGYVAAPPSVHPSGAVYTWLVPLVVDGAITGVHWLPEQIETKLTVAQLVEESPMRETGPGDIRDLARAVERGEEGNRNHLLYWAACSARTDGASLAEALAALVPAAEKSGVGAVEARRTVRSAYSA